MFVLVGVWGDSMKAFGPFETEDAAREACNELATLEASWTIAPLIGDS